MTKKTRPRRPAGKAWRKPLPKQRGLTVAQTIEADRPGCMWIGLTWVAVPLLICAALIPIGLDVVPSWSAKLWQGVRGTFTAEYCGRGKAGCDWVGEFISDDGTDQRYGVGVDGDNAITAVGQQIPALDTGDRVNVYPAGGGTDWITSTVFASLLLALLGVWFAKVPMAAFLRAAKRRSAARLSTADAVHRS